MANAYYNFLENKAGLGKNGTHIAHSAAAGGATWAAGKYGGIEMIQDNWYSPFIGALAGLGMSITVRYLLVGGDEEKSMDLVLEKIEQDSKGRAWTSDQRKRLAKVIGEVKANAPKEIENEERELEDAVRALS